MKYIAGGSNCGREHPPRRNTKGRSEIARDDRDRELRRYRPAMLLKVAVPPRRTKVQQFRDHVAPLAMASWEDARAQLSQQPRHAFLWEVLRPRPWPGPRQALQQPGHVFLGETGWQSGIPPVGVARPSNDPSKFANCSVGHERIMLKPSQQQPLGGREDVNGGPSVAQNSGHFVLKTGQRHDVLQAVGREHFVEDLVRERKRTAVVLDYAVDPVVAIVGAGDVDRHDRHSPLTERARLVACSAADLQHSVAVADQMTPRLHFRVPNGMEPSLIRHLSQRSP